MVCMNGSNSVVDPGSRDRTQIPHAASNDAIVHIDSNRKEGLQDIVAQSVARQYSWPYAGTQGTGTRVALVSQPFLAPMAAATAVMASQNPATKSGLE